MKWNHQHYHQFLQEIAEKGGTKIIKEICQFVDVGFTSK